jgi:hypothetical protein
MRARGVAGCCAAAVLGLAAAPAVAIQEHVPDPSFETLANPPTCPCNYSQIDYTKYWFNANETTSDLFMPCAACSTTKVSVPANTVGTQVPVDGDAYAGLIAYLDYDIPWREYLETPLVPPLAAGVTYEIDFWVSLADGSGFAVTSLAAFVSVGSLTSTGWDPIGLLPQIEHSGSVLSNAEGWTRISGEYTAIGGENFLTIGTFRPNAQMSPQPRIASPGYSDSVRDSAYYYVDDVHVRSTDPCDSAAVKLEFEPLRHDDDLATQVPLEQEYVEGGFKIQEFLLWTLGTNNPGFLGSTAIYAHPHTDLHLTAENGATSFNLVSLDLAEPVPGASLPVLPGTPVSISGAKSGGGSVQQTVPLDGEFGLQSVVLTGFDDVVSVDVDFTSPGPDRTESVQLDNVCIAPLGCICDPTITASGDRFCVSGNSEGIGWTWAIDAGAFETVPPAIGTAKDLAAAFVASINGSTVYPTASAVVSTLQPECFTLFLSGSTSFSLSVDSVGSPPCTVSGNASGCTFNPTITDASFLPPPPGTSFPHSIGSPLPALTGPAIGLVSGSLIAAGAWLLRRRGR